MDYKAMVDGLIAQEYYDAMGPIEITEDFKEKQRKRSAEVKKCNHLFVITQDEKKYTTMDGQEHYQAPTVECVHCGVSNRLVNFYNRLRNERPTSIHSGYPFEANLFLENFENWFQDGKIHDGHFNSEAVKSPFLSTSESLYINNAKYWYDAACKLKPNASREELFETMKYLLKCYRENVEKVQMFDSRINK